MWRFPFFQYRQKIIVLDNEPKKKKQKMKKGAPINCAAQKQNTRSNGGVEQ